MGDLWLFRGPVRWWLPVAGFQKFLYQESMGSWVRALLLQSRRRGPRPTCPPETAGIDRRSVEQVAQSAGISDGFEYHETYRQNKWALSAAHGVR